MDGSGREVRAESGAGFEWDAGSHLYYHPSTEFYHDPVAGWYYSSRDGQYIYENGNYMPWMSDAGNELKTHYPCNEANQGFLEHSCNFHHSKMPQLLRTYLFSICSFGFCGFCFGLHFFIILPSFP